MDHPKAENLHPASCHPGDQVRQVPAMVLRCRAGTATIAGTGQLPPESSCPRPRGSGVGFLELLPAARLELDPEHLLILLSRWSYPSSLRRWHKLCPEAPGIDGLPGSDFL